jgi:hypothetical protein
MEYNLLAKGEKITTTKNPNILLFHTLKKLTRKSLTNEVLKMK